MVVGLLEKLQLITASLGFFIPETILIITIVVLLITDLIFKHNKNRSAILYIIAITGTAASGLAVENQWILIRDTVSLFNGMISLDRWSTLWKVIFDIGLILTLMISFKTKKNDYDAEYYIVLLTINLGAHLLVMSANLLMIYLSIELMSISAYILSAYNFNKSSTEAGIKYVLFGGVSSAVLLYGLSLFYTFTGSLELFSPEFSEALMQTDVVPLTIAGLFVLAGILFKVSGSPMHIWTPDVYTAAPTPIVAFFSIVPKLAGFTILLKWVLVINLFGLGSIPWNHVLIVITVATLTIGNFSALWQSNVKRMLAYSSIAHSGFMLIAVVALTPESGSSLLFYGSIYLMMNIAAFMIAHYFEKNYDIIEITDYRKVFNAYPFLSILMVVIMISLTGLPPTAGFTAKLLIFTSLWDAYWFNADNWLLFLFIFGLINTVVSLFFYLKIPYYLIFKAEKKSLEPVKGSARLENFLGTILVLALLVLFFRPDWLMNIINSVSFAF